MCTPANGGILSLSLDVYGDMFTASDVDGFMNGTGNVPSFNRTSGNLTLNVSDFTDADEIQIGDPSGTFEISRPEIGGVSGTFGVSGGAPPADICHATNGSRSRGRQCARR